MESIERGLRREKVRLNQVEFQIDGIEKFYRTYYDSINGKLRRVACGLILALNLASPIILSNEPRDEVKIEYKTERSY